MVCPKPVYDFQGIVTLVSGKECGVQVDWSLVIGEG